MTEELKNAGYTIIESFTVGEQGFALGHSDTAPAPYVTWKYHAAAPNHFFWGHYVSTKEAAYEDYWNRINSEIEAVSERTGQAPLLPPLYLTVMPSTGGLINIRRGECGYYPSDWNRLGERAYNRKTADFANEGLGVTKKQGKAMLAGSMFGWHTKAADPRIYDENGRKKKINGSEQER